MGGSFGLMWGAPALAAAAAAAIALPVLVHLFLRRKRLPVEWAAMELLREAMRRVERRRRVERLVLLAVRCLLVACAGLAIAQPIIGAVLNTLLPPQTLVVVVDDSIASAERLAGGGSALKRSVDIARERINALSAKDRVAVIFAGRAAVEDPAPATQDRRAALAQLADAAPSERAADIPGALARATRILDMEESRGTRGTVLLASALRAGSVGALAPIAPVRPTDSNGSAPELEWVLAPEPAGANVQMALLEPVRVPGLAAEAQRLVRAIVRRDRGDGEIATTLRITGPSLVAPVERTVRLAPGERERVVDVPVSERPGDAASALRRAVAASVSADAQPLDDARSSVLTAAERLRVGVVDRRAFSVSGGLDQLPAGEWVARALAPGDAAQIEISTADPAALDLRTLAALDALVVAQPQLLSAQQWTLLADFVARGGTLVLLPVQAERAQAWMSTLRETFGAPWTAALEAQDVDPPQSLASEQPGRGVLQAIGAELSQLAPSVQVSRIVSVQVGSDQSGAQLVLADGRALVLAWRPADARGQLVVFTAAMDLAWTTLPVKPLMVPLWQEIVSEGARMSAAARTVAVGSVPWIDRPGVVELRLVGQDGAPTPGVRAVPVAAGGRVTQAIERAGVYELLDAGGRVLGVLAAVVDDAAASVAPTDRARVEAWLAGAGTWKPVAADYAGAAAAPQVGSEHGARSVLGGTQIAAWMLGAACVLAVLESLLARRFSHATPRGRGDSRRAPRVAAGGAR